DTACRVSASSSTSSILNLTRNSRQTVLRARPSAMRVCYQGVTALPERPRFTPAHHRVPAEELPGASGVEDTMHRLTLLSVIPAFVWPFGLMYGCATPSAPASTGTPDAVAVSAIQAAPGNDSSSGTPDRGGSVINTQMDSIDGLVARLAASP